MRTLLAVTVLLAAATPSLSQKCEGQRDIVFLIDTSGSVGLSNFRTMLNFASKIVRRFYIGPYDTQVGVVLFSTTVKSVIRLKDYKNKYRLLRAINKIKYRGGWTKTYLGLNYLRQHSFRHYSGHRYGVPKLAVVFTDGKSQDKRATLRAASSLKRSGVKVYSVGIGSGINWGEVDGIASSGRKRRRRGVWSAKVSRFRKLTTSSKVFHDITEKACDLGAMTSTPRR